MRKSYLNKELGTVILPDFAGVFDAFITAYRKTPTIHRKGRSAASPNRFIEIAQAAFNYAVKAELLDKNPITKHRFPKGEEKPRDRYLSDVERIRLLSAIREHRPYLIPFIEYNLAVPCRKSELVQAKREHYNPFANTILIPDSKADIPINKPVPPSMKEYFRNIPLDCPYLFYRQDREGKFHPLGDFKREWKFCLKQAGIVDTRIHDLRHISATELYSNGIPEREIMDIAGWKTPMLSTYRHKNSLKTAQKINRFFEECADTVQIAQTSASN
ncbi:MAG TPA: site-specific integrase [Chitinispirillaceae bacterium]|nr:site-specific integrase [Chitinispirillaceae bacterium]